VARLYWESPEAQVGKQALHSTSTFLKHKDKVDIYNVGSPDQVAVKRIAEIVAEEMKLQNVDFFFTAE